MSITIDHLHEHLLKIEDAVLKLGNDNSLIKKQNNKIMATLQEVKDKLAALQSSVDTNQAEVIARIQALKDQIAAGGTVTEADLDGLITQIQEIQTDVDTTDEG